MNVRIFISSLISGLLGIVTSGLLVFILNSFLVQVPRRDLGVCLLFGLPAGFITCFLAYLLYSKEGFDLASLFGAIAGAITGAISGIGWIIASEPSSPTALDYFGNALFGALLGTVIGLVMGKIFGQLIAKITKVGY
jgi:hypothetical protein